MSIMELDFTQCPVEWEHQFTRSEFDWVAIDEGGHIGYFMSAGAGPVPSASLSNSQSLERVDEFFHALPQRCKSLNLVHASRDVSEWQRLASKGVYAFDWRRESDTYELVAKPEMPLPFSELEDARIRNLAKRVVLPIRFSASQAVKFER